MDSLTYTPTGVTAREVGEKLDQVWNELNKPGSPLAERAQSLQVDLSQVKGKSRADLVTVNEQGSGLAPATTAIIVAFAPTAAKILRDLWDRILLPRILHDLGSDSLTPKKRLEDRKSS